MGLSSSSSKTTSDSTVKPVYEKQIMGAYDGLNSAFDANQGNINNIQGMLNGLLPTAMANYQHNPAMDAAKGYVTSTLNTPYSANPQLQAMIDQTGMSVGNKTNALLGTRGLAGGSIAAKTIAGQLAQNETGLRYSDYNSWQQRQAQAAGMAPGLAAGDATNLSSALGAGQAAANLSTDNALKRAGAIGGLLGQYTSGHETGTKSDTPSMFDMWSKVAAAVAKAAAGGG